MNKQTKFARSFGRLLKWAVVNEIDFLVTHIYRTPEQQKELFDRVPKVTNCDGYNKKSAHQYGLAADLVVMRDGNLVWDACEEYTKLGSYWKSLDDKCRWGGDFSSPAGDIFHFELSQ